MKFNLEPGPYIVAVSGGVDSVALLHLLFIAQKYELIIAHYNHGIREDAGEDAKLVRKFADKYRLQYVSEEGQLGEQASEATARAARYAFLHHVKLEYKAHAIITAHHQDDLLETAVINMLRGAGRKGLTSLRSTEDIRRPLLHISKKEIIDYAKQNDLEWREDSTNENTKYLRNYIRQCILPKFAIENKQKLLDIISNQTNINDEIDQILLTLLDSQTGMGLDRIWFNSLPYQIAKEVIAMWLRESGVRDFDRKTLERLVVAGKVTHPGKQIDILHNVRISVEKDRLALVGLER